MSQGKVKTTGQLMAFIDVYLDAVIAKSEGPTVCRAWDLALNWSENNLLELEELLTAMKLTKESKEASQRTGKALLQIAGAILEDQELQAFYDNYCKKGINYAVAYGILCGKLGIEKGDAVESYVFSTVNAIVQSAVKLIPLGNVEAQKVMLDSHDLMEKTIEESLVRTIDDLSNYCPGLDFASMLHETLPVRLYMS